MTVSLAQHRDCHRHPADSQHHALPQPGFTHIGCCTSLWNGGCNNLGYSGCEMNDPYILRYGQVSDYLSCGDYAQTEVRGIGAYIPLKSWSQTVRARPSTDYRIAVYSSESDDFNHNRPSRPPDSEPPPVPTRRLQHRGCQIRPIQGAEPRRALPLSLSAFNARAAGEPGP